jgi:hypothetical protein
MNFDTAQRNEFAWVRWLVVAVADCVSLAILVFEVDNQVTAGILIGFLFVQILLAAVWTTSCNNEDDIIFEQRNFNCL